MFSAVHGPTARKRGALRLATVTAVSGLVAVGAIATAGSAVADGKPAASSSGAHATLEDAHVKVGATVDIVDSHGVKSSPVGGLFELKVDNAGVIQTYCIDLNHHTVENSTYKEVTWAESSLAGKAEAAGKINWILQHSYPSVVPDKLGAGLTKETAAAATQAAIWTLSDGVTAMPEDAAAAKLTKQLLKDATAAKEPKASLAFDKDAVSGLAGGEVGPLTLHTNATKAALALAPGAPAGVQLTDKSGKVITSATDGTEVYFKVPAGTPDGAVKVTASAQTKVPVGRAFISDGKIKSQTFILASTSDVPVNAVATAKWGTAPAVTVKNDCAKGGLDIAVSNKGSKPFEVVVLGKKLGKVPAGDTKSLFLPLAEDTTYAFDLAGQHFSGVLDCKTAGSGTPTPAASTPASKPSPASAGGSSTGTNGNGGTNLAETGSSSSTPMIAGAAVALVVLGGGAVFFLRKKKTAGQ
ncbi:Cys-Gln thioester bond-forming surface protein [Streptomyces sp. NPDC048416]|uniref:Cys-Gln thioester bond-forming surface protein n=1 Tax=Streptomyces sp. NPDC048416 TaxID=3365546 RepID=UPI0037196DC7